MPLLPARKSLFSRAGSVESAEPFALLVLFVNELGSGRLLFRLITGWLLSAIDEEDCEFS